MSVQLVDKPEEAEKPDEALRIRCLLCEERSPIESFFCMRRENLVLSPFCGGCRVSGNPNVRRLVQRVAVASKEYRPVILEGALQRRRILERLAEMSDVRYELARPGRMMGDGQEQVERLARLPRRIGVILRKTYLVMGDGAEIADDQALEEILKLVEAVDAGALDEKRTWP